MSLIASFVKRVWLTIVLWIILILLGFFFLNTIEWNVQSKVLSNNIIIRANTRYAATPSILYDYTKALESKVKGIQGIDSFSSTTEKDELYIEIALKENANTEAIMMDLRERIFSVSRPSIVDTPEVVRDSKKSVPIMTLYMHSSKYSLSELTQEMENVLKYDLERIDGVSNVKVYGSKKKEIHLILNPDKIYFYGIRSGDITDALKLLIKEDTLMSRQEGSNTLSFSLPNSLTQVEDIQNVIIMNNIKIRDIAEVKVVEPESSQIVWRNGTIPCVQLSIYKTAFGNPLNISKSVNEILLQWKKKYFLNIEQKDKSEEVRILFKKVQKTFIEAIILIILIILMSLGSFKSSITPILAIPISLIVTFIPMKLLGCSLNTTTLSAFLMAIGLVVDDAIIIVENIVRKFHKIGNLEEAAIEGTEEILWPIIIMTLTLACVFLPVILASGSFASILREFAITLCSSVIISGVLSLTLSPMLGARYLGYNATLEKIFHMIENGYKNLLLSMMNIRLFIILFAGLLFGGSLYLIPQISRENLPFTPSNNFAIYTHGKNSKNLDYFVNEGQKLISYLEKCKQEKIIDSYQILLSNKIRVNIDSSKADDQIKQKMLNKISSLCRDLRFFISMQEESNQFDIAIYENLSKEEIKEIGYLFREKLENIKTIKNIIGYASKQKEYTLTVDYQKAMELGVNPMLVKDIIRTVSSRFSIAKITIGNQKYKIVTAPDPNISIMDVLKKVYRYRGLKIQPSSFIKIEPISKETQITNYLGFPAHYLSITFDEKQPLGDLIQDIKNAYQNSVSHKARLTFTGLAKEYLDNQNQMLYLFIAAIILIALILLAQTNSLRNMIIIMITVPLSLIGAILAIFFYTTINVYTSIGIITLIGLITKHGILFINAASKYKKDGLSKAESAANGASERLRPVLITTLAMALSVVPLLFESHAVMIGLKEMAIVILPGISIGTLLVLFVVPCIYSYFGD